MGDANQHNARAWDALARQQVPLAKPASDEDFRDPLRTVDPLGWLGPCIANLSVLCLAAGGGRHSALYAAAGAVVTVVDLSGEMLALDRQVAAERGLEVTTVQASMDSLPMLADGQFDLVIHPVSTCYVPEVGPVFREVARVTRPGGIYVSQHKSPVSLQADVRPEGGVYRICEPYYRTGPLPAAEPCRTREPGTQEFLHRWEELVGGICRAGFVIEDFVEPMHAKTQAEVGTFGHRSQFVAPYVRVKARRIENDKQTSILRVE
ncbi:MAG: class I SAM-dependent methyltransferase [Planctomycetes bacterium]|nr:class I SAM-dependent methyltransferase [Planctomycetota bacterium]